jgi:Zn-dependent metalloprotease
MNGNRFEASKVSGAFFTAIAAILATLSGCGAELPESEESTVSEAEAAQTQAASPGDVGDDHREIALQRLEERLAARGIDARRDLEVIRAETDDLAMSHVRVQQTVKGVPVFGGQAIVHLDADGETFAVTDDLVGDIDRALDTTPSLDAREAAEIVVNDYTCPTCLTAEPAVDLWVLRRGEDKRDRHARAAVRDHLVYRVQLQRLDGTSDTAMPVVFIDAKNGRKVWEYDNLQTATGVGMGLYTTYHVSMQTYKPATSSLYHLQDLNRKVGTFTRNGTENELYTVTDNDNIWTSAWQNPAVDAHFGAEMALDYFRGFFGRNGIDGAGGPTYVMSNDGVTPLFAQVINYGTNVNNAMWTGDHAWYGNGDGSLFSPLVTLDIVGHELTHGVTQNTAGLIYAGESGALNESMSDVFGAMIERYTRTEDANTWRIGEQCYTPATAGDAMRHMDEPYNGTSNGYIGHDPDHWTVRYTGTIDNSGVHSNSGIGNKAFYLAAKGGSHRLGGSMTGIGAQEAAGIWYRALTQYMTASTDYHGARKATLNAASALHGAGSTQRAVVQKAWSLVGVDKCSTGSALQADDSSSVAAICAADSYCCNNNWDSICVGEARTIANSLACPESQGTCGHGICTTGGPLASGCDSGKAACVASICAVDPFCCNNNWDVYCVGEVESVCGKNCN